MRLIRLLKRDLAKETSEWVAQDLISLEQARSICRQYDIDYDEVQNRSTGYRLLISLGYLFIGLAVITLLGANWDEIPRGLRMAGLLIITLGTHGLALKAYLEGKESPATGLFLLGNLFYGASIVLIAQIYHLGEHMPDGVFWWALGSLPFGVLLKSPGLTLFSCLLALIWFFLEYDMGYFPTLFPVFIAAAVYVLFQERASTLLFLTTVMSIGIWIETFLSSAWASEQVRMSWHVEHLLVSAALFVLAYAISNWLLARASSKAKDYGVLLSLWTLRFALIAMLIMSYEEPWRGLITADWAHQASMWQVVLVLLGASMWLGWKTGTLPIIASLTAFLVASMIALLSFGTVDNAIYFQVTYNIALVAAAILLILHGIQSGTSHYFFLGIATILLVALMRYIDLIGEYIGGAILFMVLAFLLLGAARFWKAQQTQEAKA